MESSPRFTSTDSSAEDNSTYPYHHRSPAPAASVAPTKLRLMCSNGGHIVPRPHDKSLCYVGGETRMVAIDRHTTLLDLTRRLSKTPFRSPPASSFTLKYQLPSEDLDSLITVTTDEDLENMIDEYERLNSSSRLRLFIFPTNPGSISSIGSFLENPIKSDDWFLNALNGTNNSGFSDTSSVNCLLDLDDEISPPEKKNNNSGQDVHSIPDLPMMETTSSFGSASSTPSHANLLLVDDQKRHLKHHDDGGLIGSPAPVVVSGSLTANSEHADPFLFHHERSDQGLQMTYLKHQHLQQQQQQNQSTGFDLASMDSILSDLTITDQSSPVSQIQSSNHNNRAADPNDTKIQMLQQQKVHNPAYSSSMPTTRVNSPRHQQPQFIPPPQYIHHHHPSVAVPVTSYYHHPPMDQQNFMYYIPASRQAPQGYNFPIQQPQQPPPPVAAGKTELPAAGVYGTTNSGGPQLVRVSSGFQNQGQHVGYSEIHQPNQSVYYATPVSTAQYQKMTSVSPVETSQHSR